VLLDSSAIVAVMLREPGWEILRDRIDGAGSIEIGAPTLLEAHLVLTNRTGRDALPLLDAFTREIGAQVIPFTEAHWRAGAEGFLRYGKGRHGAGLNFGDCMAYGAARVTGLPLLYKGADFGLTDVG
jgi:ribonuclease VapC